MSMQEVRIHGRGGQGNVAAAELLAQAAFAAGAYAQAFPAFGAERTGAPVVAFVRLHNRPIRIRSQVYTPGYLIIQDPTLLHAGVGAITAGLAPGGLVLLNAAQVPPELAAALPPGARAVAIPATDIALEVIGRPVPNTTLLGAFAALTGAFPLEAVQQAARERFPGLIGERNAAAAARGYAAAKAARPVSNGTAPAPAARAPTSGPLFIITPGLVAGPGTSAGPDGYHTGSWRTFRPIWDPARCTDCRLCVVYCPESVVSRIGPKHYASDLDFCKGCGICAEECPPKAIAMVREDEARAAVQAALAS